jgi:hypothetical protein
MNKQQAQQFVRDTSDDDQIDDDDLVEVFTALYDRAPDENDRNDGLWNLCCAAIA